MSFSIGSEEGLDDEIRELLNTLYGAAEAAEDQEEEKDKEAIVSVEDILGIKDSLTLVKCAPLGSKITVNYDDDDEEGQSTYAVETKPSSGEPNHQANRRMSIVNATKRVSIGMSIRCSDGIDSELQDILLQLYDEEDGEGEDVEGTDEALMEDIRSGLGQMGIRRGSSIYELGIKRDSLSLVKCRRFNRRACATPFEDLAEESEEKDATSNNSNTLMETKQN